MSISSVKNSGIGGVKSNAISDIDKTVDGIPVDFLLVGGGGNPHLGQANNIYSGGGGAGGVITSVVGDTSGGNSNNPTPKFIATPGTSYQVEIGANKGETYLQGVTVSPGGSSGSGSVNNNPAACTTGGDNQAGSSDNYIINQGFQGGDGYSGAKTGAGGGGGAGGVGSNATNNNGADGGVGRISTIISASDATTYAVGEVSGSDVYFGGGGGGSGVSTAGDGGLGGGGNGNTGTNTGQDAAANTGGGGGGTYNALSGYGASGVAILKFPDTYTITVGAGLTDATSGGITSGGFTTVILTAGTDTVSWS